MTLERKTTIFDQLVRDLSADEQGTFGTLMAYYILGNDKKLQETLATAKTNVATVFSNITTDNETPRPEAEVLEAYAQFLGVKIDEITGAINNLINPPLPSDSEGI